MKVIVYLEGPSDTKAMQSLMGDLCDQARKGGCGVSFVHMRKATKQALMAQIPLKAVNILRNELDSHVFAVPDLHPRNVGLRHSTCGELKSGLNDVFCRECKRLNVNPKPFLARFHVHCFKHDMEALILACRQKLLDRLHVKKFPHEVRWCGVPEDQDFGRWPKRVVEELFHHVGDKYVDTVDAPQILAGADPRELAEVCSQCFGPFFHELVAVAGLGA